MKSERSVGEMAAATEDEKEGSRKTAKEEFTSSSKKRKIRDDSSFSRSADSETNSTALSHSLKTTDLKQENSETEVSTFSIGDFSKETTIRSSEACGGDSGEAMESSSSTIEKKASPQKNRAAEAPPAAEIEAFFSAAEKYEQKWFAEKYNYDIVKDIPLEGRYKWIGFEAAMNDKGTKEMRGEDNIPSTII